MQGLGVSFPDWSSASIGHSIAFIDTNFEVLNELKNQAYFLDMEEYGSFSISEVKPVPDNVPEVRFIRNQNISKMFAGSAKRRLKRLAKRAAERGEVFAPKAGDKEKTFELFHRAIAKSGSNGQEFVLHIQKEVAEDADTRGFCSYGLATNELHRGSVPELQFVPREK